MKKLFLFTALLFLYAGLSSAADSDWSTYTNASDIYDCAVSGDAIWCATNGGLLALDVNSLQFNKYTTNDGLHAILMSAIEIDRNKNVWMAFDDGIIQQLNIDNMQWDMVLEYEGLTINDIYAYGDSLFICMNIGISLFDINNWEVKETYKIGNVKNIAIHDKIIWAATPNGVKMADLDFPNLIAPSAWTTYNTSNGLPNTEVHSVYAHGDLIVAGTNLGMAFLQGDTWVADGIDQQAWFGFADWDGTLVGVCHYGVYSYSETSGWGRLSHNVYNIQCMAVGPQNRIWVGQTKNGFYYYTQGNNTWTNLVPAGPITNSLSAVKVDKAGRLWCASRTEGVSMFNGTDWFHYSLRNGKLNSNDFRDIKVDNQGRIWLASFGGGVSIFTPVSDDSFDIKIFHKDRLSGSSNADYVTTTALELDNQGNMWILNYAAASNNPLAVVDSTLTRWQYFSITDGIGSRNLEEIEIDQYGRKWLGSDDKGIYVLDDNDTPFNKSDDEMDGTLTTTDGLASNVITSIAMDFDEVFYIGTPEGLNTYFAGQVSEYLDNRVINNSINTIVVDGVNNKWVGTLGGLSMLHSDGFDTTHYIAETHPLVADNVTSLAFNEDTGDLYIATANGLSRLSTPFKKPSASLDFVKGYPNPFIIGGPASNFYIDNLGKQSQVTIFSAEGFLIKKLSEEQVLGSRAVWDGTNDRGEFVTSGVYIYQILTKDGAAKVGKVAVIRP